MHVSRIEIEQGILFCPLIHQLGGKDHELRLETPVSHYLKTSGTVHMKLARITSKRGR